jgi:hypothetical protein
VPNKYVWTRRPYVTVESAKDLAVTRDGRIALLVNGEWRIPIRRR